MRFLGSTSVFARQHDRLRAAFWAALRWRKAVVLYVLLLALGAGFIAAKLATPVYRSRVILEVKPEKEICDFPGWQSASANADAAAITIFVVPLSLFALLLAVRFCLGGERADAGKEDA